MDKYFRIQNNFRKIVKLMWQTEALYLLHAQNTSSGYMLGIIDLKDSVLYLETENFKELSQF